MVVKSLFGNRTLEAAGTRCVAVRGWVQGLKRRLCMMQELAEQRMTKRGWWCSSLCPSGIPLVMKRGLRKAEWKKKAALLGWVSQLWFRTMYSLTINQSFLERSQRGARTDHSSGRSRSFLAVAHSVTSALGWPEVWDFAQSKRRTAKSKRCLYRT